jgi:hypothetical protein
MGYGDCVLQIGQETYYTVRNASGSQMENGVAVYASGVTVGSGRIEIGRMVADGTIREVRFLGLCTHDINNGVNGLVTYFGYVRGSATTPLDTRGTASTPISVGDENWQVGDILYVHPTVPGKLTNVKPKHAIYVATVIIRNQTTGKLFVRPSDYGHLDDLHDVKISGETNGDLLVYDQSIDYWVNSKSLTGDYTISGDTIQYGDVFQQSASGTSLTTGTNIITTIPVTSGCSANFDYCVTENGGAMRAGTVKVVWNNSSAGYTDYSTTDIVGSTSGISFTADVSGGNVRLNAVITSGTWSVKVSTNVVF